VGIVTDGMAGIHRHRRMVWSDDANRPDSAAMGDLWSEGEAGQGAGIQITSNTFIQIGSSAAFARHLFYIPSLDQFMQGRVTDPGTGMGLMLRSLGPWDQTHYMGWIGGTIAEIDRYIPSGAAIASRTGVTVNVGDVWRFEIRQTVLQFFVNGQLLLSIRDTDHTLQRGPRYWAGVRMDGTNDVGMDDLMAGAL
jgi:hypothetical protein